MRTKEQLLERPNYLLTKYQSEIFRQVKNYMEQNKLTQKDFAIKLGEVSGKPGGVSEAYVSQILNGNFNFTLKKLIELGIAIGKVPVMNFETTDKYWSTQIKPEKKEQKVKKKIATLDTKRKKIANPKYALAS